MLFNCCLCCSIVVYVVQLLDRLFDCCIGCSIVIYVVGNIEFV